MTTRSVRLTFSRAILLLGLLGPGVGSAQLHENCTVSILNRTIRVDSNGSWRLNNVPVGFGPVRARATCVGPGGTTQAGQTSFINLVANQTNAFDTDIVLGVVDPVPQFLTLSAPATVLTTVGATTQLTVTAVFADNSTADVTSPLLGTSYNISNQAIATVSNSGLVTAVSSGTVVVSSMNDGALGVIQLEVMLDGADSDGDGIPDDVEVSFGLNPNDPSDAQLDLDNDGLTNLAEFNLGTTINDPDSDGDGIQDGEETVAGADGFVTNPLLADTDGDGIRDGLEIATMSDPTDAGSFNLAEALSSVSITPSTFVLVVGLLKSTETRQLAVIGNLIDGSTIDLTSQALGTQYTTSPPSICGFDPGTPDGLLSGRMPGACVVSISNNGFSAQSVGAVQPPDLRALSVIPIPGYANNVDVNGDLAYVAAGQTGLHAVDISDRANPQITETVDTPGNANDVKILGDYAYVADGAAGLQIVDLADPSGPQIVGSVDTSGVAQDVVVQGTLAFVADGASGVQIIDVTNPAAPALLGTATTPGTAKGVDADLTRQVAVVADGTAGMHTIDIADPASPQIVASVPGFTDARDVVLENGVAYVADFLLTVGVVVVSVEDPEVPDVLTILGGAAGVPNDLAVRENLVFAADGMLSAAQDTEIPIVDVMDPSVRAGTLQFQNEHQGTGIAIDGSFAYLTAAAVETENGATGDTYLYVGQYFEPADTAGIPPLTQIISPAPGAAAPEGGKLPVTVDATDDIAVGFVEFLLDGQVVYRDTTPPYQYLVLVPTGVTTAILGARAVDFGGNVGVAPDVSVNVIPDPLTTVTGRVLDPDANPVTGASVKVFDSSPSLTGLDGTFSIPMVPTISGAIRANATAMVGGQLLGGTSSSFAPVLGGTTNVGDIVLGRLPLFTGQKTFIGELPTEIILADVNLDGIEDVITANEGTDDVSVALGNPNGSFQPAASFAAGGGLPSLSFADGPFSVAAGDLNGDGLTDLVTANRSADDISVLLGNGDGTFQQQIRLTLDQDSNPNHVSLGHLNGDQALDLVVNERGLGRLMVCFGDGAGGIASSIQLPMDNPAGSVLGDTNNDGFLDVVSPSAIEGGGINLSLPGTVRQSGTDSVFVFRGDGAGNFEPPNSYDSGIIFQDSQGRPAPLVLHEINGDSSLDLITAGENANQISLLFGDGSGGFQTPQILSIPSAPSAGVESLAVVNANADSIPDIVALLRGGQVSVFHGTGNGAFGPEQPSPTEDAEAMVVADVDRDGSPDVVLARDANSGLVSGDFIVLFGNAQGVFETELVSSTAPGFSPQSLVLADFDEDGDLDVAAETREGKVLLGNGDGTFGPPIFLDDPDSQRSAIAAGDLNGDGNLDIVMTSGFNQSGSPGKVTIFAGDGAGGFQELFEFPVGTGPRSVALALLNNDGILDLATANAFSDDVSVLLGNGDGTFQAAQSFSAGNTAVSIAAADFNEDNMLDLVAANEFSDNLLILIGDGQGGFTALPFLSVGGRPREVVAVDLNLDTHVDIATANVESDDLTVLFGDGTGGFTPPLTLDLGASPVSLSAADLDDDGFPDLVAASSTADDVAVFFSDGLGGFRPEQRFTINGNTTSAVAGDVNGDSKPDIVIGAGGVVVLLQR